MSQFRASHWMCVAAAVIITGCGGSAAKDSPPVFTPSAPAFVTVIKDSFVVSPRTFTPFEFVVDSGMINPRLEGTFSASGRNNDIEVLLLESSQFLNWQNKLKFRATYDSGRVTADKLQLELPSFPAKYVIIFSNRFSIFSNKGVIADLKLVYDRATQ